MARVTALLVCEGKCSPHTKEYDRVASAHSRERNSNALPRRTNAQLRCIELAPKLVHTPHVYVGPTPGHSDRDQYECADCGTMRTF